MSEFLAETFIGSMPLDPTDRLFRCPSGLFFECRGIAWAVPVKIDKIEVCLDFHVYPIVDFDLLIGYPLENLHLSPLGSLYEQLGNSTYATPCFENPLAKPFPKQNSLEMIVQPSSSTIEYEPRPTSPHCVVLDHDRDTTMIFHDEPLAIKKPLGYGI